MAKVASCLPLRGQCSSCLAPNGVLATPYYASLAHLCPKCLKQVAAWKAAETHLEELVFLVLRLWDEVWSDVEGKCTGIQALSALVERVEVRELEERRQKGVKDDQLHHQ